MRRLEDLAVEITWPKRLITDKRWGDCSSLRAPLALCPFFLEIPMLISAVQLTPKYLFATVTRAAFAANCRMLLQ